jgi:hypothetical protein
VWTVRHGAVVGYGGLGLVFVVPGVRPPARKLLCRLGGLAVLQGLAVVGLAVGTVCVCVCVCVCVHVRVRVCVVCVCVFVHIYMYYIYILYVYVCVYIYTYIYTYTYIIYRTPWRPCCGSP